METPLQEAELHKLPLQKQMRDIAPWYVPNAHLSWLSGTGTSEHRLKRNKCVMIEKEISVALSIDFDHLSFEGKMYIDI